MRGPPGRRFRFSIAAIMAIIALLAVDVASLRVATNAYLEIARHLTLVMLVLASYQAQNQKGDRAAWWYGFALWGWTYFALDILPQLWLPRLAVIADLTSQLRPEIQQRLDGYEIIQLIVTMIVAFIGGYVELITNRRQGAPDREQERRSGRLDLDHQVE
jgi:hypothetical protein